MGSTYCSGSGYVLGKRIGSSFDLVEIESLLYIGYGSNSVTVSGITRKVSEIHECDGSEDDKDRDDDDKFYESKSFHLTIHLTMIFCFHIRKRVRK